MRDLDWSDLVEHVTYLPETGEFIRTKLFEGKGTGREALGKIKGAITPYGYISISYRSKRYQAHRLAWFWMTGEWPERDTDHVNRNRSDNRWENLRELTRAENNQNKRVRSDNLFGVKGVVKHKNRWVAQITVAGVRKYLGRFQCIGQAISARKYAEKELHQYRAVA